MSRHCITPLYAISFDLSQDGYQERFETLAADGYRLDQVNGYPTANGTRYGGIWVRDNATMLTPSSHHVKSSAYQSFYDDLRFRGFRLTCISGYDTSSGPYFAVAWIDGSFQSMHTHHGMTANEYQAKFDEYAGLGYRLVWVNGYADGSDSRYAAIWSKYGPADSKARHNLPSSDYQSTYDSLKSLGYRIKVVSAHKAGAKTYFAGLWVKESGYEPTAAHNMSSDDVETKCRSLADSDWQATCLNGYEEDSKDKFAAVWVKNSRRWLVQGPSDAQFASIDSAMESFMKLNMIPGASLAITRNAKLVLARGYSWITDAEEPVHATSLFRIASVSKTFTSAAILKLIEQKKLSLDSKLAMVINLPGTMADSRMNDITIDHLLHHMGGWDRTTFDPMVQDLEISKSYGMPLPITQEAIIRWMTEKKLDYSPGGTGLTSAMNRYSNYGYMLLGRIVEDVSGMQYEAFVQKYLLDPLNIRRMKLGRSLLSSRLPNDVLYHYKGGYGLYENRMAEGAPVNVMRQYGGYRNLTNIAAHGGWVAAAVDLVRYSSSFDNAATCPILNSSSVNELSFWNKAYPDIGKNTHYGCGWYVDRESDVTYHGGNIEGTLASLERWTHKTNGQFDLGIIFNGELAGENNWTIVNSIRNILSAINTWPNVDYRDDFF